MICAPGLGGAIRGVIVATYPGKTSRPLRRFDIFGSGLQPSGCELIDDRLNYCLVKVSVSEAMNEAAVDLDVVHFELLEAGGRQEGGAEVVDRDADAKRPQWTKVVGGNADMAVCGSFSDFHRWALWMRARSG
nr:hypothetical protein [Acidocella sp.]